MLGRGLSADPARELGPPPRRPTLQHLSRMSSQDTLLWARLSARFRLPPTQTGPAGSQCREAGNCEDKHGLSAQRMYVAEWSQSAPGAIFQWLGRGDWGSRVRIGRQYPQPRLALHVDDGFLFGPGPRQNTRDCHPPGIGPCSQGNRGAFQRSRAGFDPDY